MQKYVTGDTTAFTFTVTDDAGVAQNLTGATIKLGIRRPLGGGNAVAAAGPWTCSSVETGAAWASGIVVGVVLGADTGSLAPGVYQFELEVTRSGKPATVIPAEKVRVYKGTVT